MSRLTVAEKEHWKQRIEARIARAIEKVKAGQPEKFQNIQRILKLEAHRKLGTADEYQRILKLDEAIGKLQEERSEIELRMHQLVVGNESLMNRWDREQSFRSKLSATERIVEVELYTKLPEGQQILKLKEEKESLLDTIWLATSPVQIRGLWTELASLLGDENTELQRQVLSKVEAL